MQRPKLRSGRRQRASPRSSSGHPGAGPVRARIAMPLAPFAPCSAFMITPHRSSRREGAENRLIDLCDQLCTVGALQLVRGGAWGRSVGSPSASTKRLTMIGQTLGVEHVARLLFDAAEVHTDHALAWIKVLRTACAAAAGR